SHLHYALSEMREVAKNTVEVCLVQYKQIATSAGADIRHARRRHQQRDLAEKVAVLQDLHYLAGVIQHLDLAAGQQIHFAADLAFADDRFSRLYHSWTQRHDNLGEEKRVSLLEEGYLFQHVIRDHFKPASV